MVINWSIDKRRGGDVLHGFYQVVGSIRTLERHLTNFGLQYGVNSRRIKSH